MQNLIDPILVYILVSTLIIGGFSAIGLITLVFNKKFINQILIIFVSLSAGTLLGGAFFHLLPESIEFIGIKATTYTLVASFITFFLFEKLFHWHHHELGTKQQIGYISLLVDSIHNFIDGLIIASSFLINIPLGITTSTSILLHEIPQELGDFGVLLHSGFSIRKTIILNFLISTTAILGGFIGYFYISVFSPNITGFIISFAAGGFLYLSTSDLVPEIKGHRSKKTSIFSILFLIGGVLLMAFLKD